MLQVISEADILYGKIMKNQEWRLLRYLDAILIKLYKKDTSIRYNKFNLSWPLLNRLRWDGKNIKAFATVMAKQMHISRSTFGTFYLPYLLFCLKNNQFEFPLEESYGELVQKEMELIK